MDEGYGQLCVVEAWFLPQDTHQHKPLANEVRRISRGYLASIWLDAQQCCVSRAQRIHLL